LENERRWEENYNMALKETDCEDGREIELAEESFQ
jgi:hypothetical protein